MRSNFPSLVLLHINKKLSCFFICHDVFQVCTTNTATALKWIWATHKKNEVASTDYLGAYWLRHTSSELVDLYLWALLFRLFLFFTNDHLIWHMQVFIGSRKQTFSLLDEYPSQYSLIFSSLLLSAQCTTQQKIATECSAEECHLLLKAVFDL